MTTKSKQAFSVCEHVDHVSRGKTLYELNPDSKPHTVSNCGPVLATNPCVVPAHSYAEVTVLPGAPHGAYQPKHNPDCPIKTQPKIIIA